MEPTLNLKLLSDRLAIGYRYSATLYTAMLKESKHALVGVVQDRYGNQFVKKH